MISQAAPKYRVEKINSIWTVIDQQDKITAICSCRFDADDLATEMNLYAAGRDNRRTPLSRPHPEEI